MSKANTKTTADSAAEGVASGSLPYLRDGIIQIGLVVENLERAAEAYWKIFGIGPWRIYTYRKPLLKTLEYRGEPSAASFRVALCQVDALSFELIEPGEGPSIYHDFVREHGYGLHHLALAVEDIEEAIAAAREAGIAVIQQGGGQGADGSGHFAYLDTEAELGATFEFVQFPGRRVPPETVYPPESDGPGPEGGAADTR